MWNKKTLLRNRRKEVTWFTLEQSSKSLYFHLQFSYDERHWWHTSRVRKWGSNRWHWCRSSPPSLPSRRAHSFLLIPFLLCLCKVCIRLVSCLLTHPNHILRLKKKLYFTVLIFQYRATLLIGNNFEAPSQGREASKLDRKLILTLLF